MRYSINKYYVSFHINLMTFLPVYTLTLTLGYAIIKYYIVFRMTLMLLFAVFFSCWFFSTLRRSKSILMTKYLFPKLEMKTLFIKDITLTLLHTYYLELRIRYLTIWCFGLVTFRLNVSFFLLLNDVAWRSTFLSWFIEVREFDLLILE